MIVEKLDKDKVTISFSRKIGSTGIKRVKEYIEFLERASTVKLKKVPQSAINKLADEISEAAWNKFKKQRGL
ncbi:hypothetical protein PDL71_05480 [Lacibacter sp. MH-610]|uniref:hypothetical protein n=1 Tax=Lacibacter sp. MH-610 TaxID=3020883 RepID=UPI00389154CA